MLITTQITDFKLPNSPERDELIELITEHGGQIYANVGYDSVRGSMIVVSIQIGNCYCSFAMTSDEMPHIIPVFVAPALYSLKKFAAENGGWSIGGSYPTKLEF